jgi:hypothetical protein
MTLRQNHFTMDYPDNEGRIIHFKLTKKTTFYQMIFMLGINNSIATTEKSRHGCNTIKGRLL